MCIRCFRVRRFGRGHFGPKRYKLSLKRRAFGVARLAALFGLGERLGMLPIFPRYLLQLPERAGRDMGRVRQRLRRENEVRRRFGSTCIGAREPVGYVEQLADGGNRLRRRHGTGFVHRCVAEVFDDPRLGDDRLSDQTTETRLVDPCRQSAEPRLATECWLGSTRR
jgi:hypothetical protein